MIVLAAFAGLALVDQAPAPVDPPTIARGFLEAFAADPAAAKKLATKDAVIVFGDIGGSYDDYVNVIRSAGSWLKTCQVTSVSGKPAPTAEALKDAEPRHQGGKISVLDSVYSCIRPDGTKGNVEVRVVLKDAKVSDVYFQGGPR